MSVERDPTAVARRELAELRELRDPAEHRGDLPAAAPPLEGLVLRLLRKALRRWERPQVEFNAQTVATLEVLQREVARLGGVEAHLRSLDRHVAALERELERLRAEREEAPAEPQRARDHEPRITALERELAGGRARIEPLLARLQEIVAQQAARGEAAPEAANAIGALRAEQRGVAGLAFEDLHRGDQREIAERQRVYLPYFEPAVRAGHELLDLGCGRGEFVELARAHGLAARGVDRDPDMVAECRRRGLRVEQADALEHLRSLPESSLGGILLAQVVEHLELDQLTELIGLAAARLAPGGVLIAETVNPACLSTFAGAFYMDLTHVRPIHPEAARFLWRWAGLGDVELLFLSPHADAERLELVGDAAGRAAAALDRNAEKLNRLIFGHRDYAVVGRR